MKTIKICLDGQSKGVVASVEIQAEEVEGEKVLEEVKKLFEEADKYATVKSIQKMR